MATKRAFQRNLRDAALSVLIALPAAAGATVVTPNLDTQVRSERASFFEELDLVLTVPALSTVIVPDTKTVTVTLEMCAEPTFAAPTQLRTLTQTGAGGVGVPAFEIRTSLPTDLLRYVRGKITFGALTTTGAAISAELCLVR